MTGSLRPRTLLLVLLAIAIWGASVGAGPAAAFRTLHHRDPYAAFPKGKTKRIAHAASGLTPLASDWACDETTVDLGEFLSNAPQVKVLYAYPTDVADQLVGGLNYGKLIQADANAVRDKLATSGRSVRFDVGGTGPACTNSAQYLDIQTIALAHDKAFYSGPQAFARLTDELEATLVKPSGGRRVNYVVYADQIAPGTTIAGQADVLQDNSHDLENASNQGPAGNGRLFAIVYGRGGADFNNGYGDSSRQATFLHEMTHTFGAVQNNAPHASGAGHCWDEYDVMCYADGGPKVPQGTFDGFGGLQGTPQCAGGPPFSMTETYDCNQDDYFNPSPAAGTYLAQNWNSFDSVFLCDVSDCDLPLSRPPAITLGTTHVDGRLAFMATPASGSIAHYEWDIDGDGIYDADTRTTPTITPDLRSVEARTVRVRASKADGTFAFDSATITPTPPSPQFTVNGTFQVGQTLQLDGTPTQDPDGLITRFLWDLDGDGAYETDTGLTATATTSFLLPGTRSVGLAVEYPLGLSFSRTQPFLIASASALLPPGGAASVAGPSLRLTKVKLGKLVKTGLPLLVTCGAPCTMRLTLTVSAKTAKKLHLKGKPIVIGRARGGFAAGRTKPILTLTAAAKRALKKARSLSAVLAGSVTQRSPALKISTPLTFKR